MARKFQQQATDSTSSEEFRIGLVSDTHDTPDPVAVIRRLAQQNCDYHIHLGDIGGSRLVSKIVREFKQTLGNIENLSLDDQRRFHELRNQGMTPVWAYIETRLGSDPISRSRRLQETQESYGAILTEMRELTSPIFVSGNIDSSLVKSNLVAPEFHKNNAMLISEPHYLSLGSNLAILWPSIKGSEAELAYRLDQTVDLLSEVVKNKRRVVILAHEQLFKGPPPGKYKSNVEAAGYTATTVPYFEPNPSWKFLLRLLRAAPSEVDLAFVYGHVHDPHHVIQAGAPYLKGSVAQGLEYRLFGLGSPASSCGGNGRRSVRMFCVPSSKVAVLTLGRNGLHFEIVSP